MVFVPEDRPLPLEGAAQLKKIGHALRRKLSRFDYFFTYGLRVEKPLLIARGLAASLRCRLHAGPWLRALELSLGYDCDFSCKHCYNTTLRKDEPILTVEEYARVVREAMHLGAVTFNFEGGETLQYAEKLFGVVPKCSPERNLMVVTTNGYRLTRDMAFRLREAGIDCVRISIDSGIATEHDGFRGMGGSYERCLSAIGHCHEAGLPVIVNTVLTPENLRSRGLRELLDFTHRRRIFHQGILGTPSGRWKSKRDVLLSESDFTYLAGLRNRYPYFYNHIDADTQRGKACPSGRDTLYITPYGDVMGCSYIQISEGNIRRQSLEEIYRRMRVHPWFSQRHPRCLIAEDPMFIRRYLRLVKESEGPFPLSPANWERMAGQASDDEGGEGAHA